MPGGPPRWMFDLLLKAPTEDASGTSIDFELPHHPVIINLMKA